MTRLFVIVALAAVWSAAAAAAADLTAGETAFNRCKMCHTIQANGANRTGPNLHGLIGRKAGAVPGFAYSDAMKHSSIIWDDQTLARFLRDPKESLPGNRMSYPGIKDDAVLADLIAYLNQASR